MEYSNTPNSGSALAAMIPTKINNPRFASISQVDNGYIINMGKVNEYGEMRKIATTFDEAMLLLATYFEQV